MYEVKKVMPKNNQNPVIRVLSLFIVSVCISGVLFAIGFPSGSGSPSTERQVVNRDMTGTGDGQIVSQTTRQDQLYNFRFTNYSSSTCPASGNGVYISRSSLLVRHRINDLASRIEISTLEASRAYELYRALNLRLVGQIEVNDSNRELYQNSKSVFRLTSAVDSSSYIFLTTGVPSSPSYLLYQETGSTLQEVTRFDFRALNGTLLLPTTRQEDLEPIHREVAEILLGYLSGSRTLDYQFTLADDTLTVVPYVNTRATRFGERHSIRVSWHCTYMGSTSGDFPPGPDLGSFTIDLVTGSLGFEPSPVPSAGPSYAPSYFPSYVPTTGPSYFPSYAPTYAPPTAPSCFFREATIVGTEGNDVINGTAGDDVIVGLGGDDVILGLGGNDVICGNDGNDTLRGNGGDDYLSGQNGNDKIYGGPGHDRIGETLYNPEEGADELNGEAGNDWISDYNGENKVDGGAGNDDINAHSTQHVVYGGTGNDRIQASGPSSNVDAGPGNDYISGGIGKDNISGGAGDDEINGQEGDDSLNGDSGNDTIYGNAGKDTVSGGGGNDYLHGGTVYVGGSFFIDRNDKAIGGLGTDTCIAERKVGCER